MRTYKLTMLTLFCLFAFGQAFGDYNKPPEPIDLEIMDIIYIPIGLNMYTVDVAFNESACDPYEGDHVVTLNVGGDVYQMITPVGLGNLCPCMQQVDHPDCNETCVPLNATCERFIWTVFDYCACIFNNLLSFEGIEILPGEMIAVELDSDGQVGEWFEDNNYMEVQLPGQPVLPDNTVDLSAVAADAIPLGGDYYDIDFFYSVGSCGTDIGSLAYDITLFVDGEMVGDVLASPIDLGVCPCMEQADWPHCDATCAPIWPDADCRRFVRWGLDYCYCDFGWNFKFLNYEIPEGSTVCIMIDDQELVPEWDEGNNSFCFVIEPIATSIETWTTLKRTYE